MANTTNLLELVNLRLKFLGLKDDVALSTLNNLVADFLLKTLGSVSVNELEYAIETQQASDMIKYNLYPDKSYDVYSIEMYKEGDDYCIILFMNNTYCFISYGNGVYKTSIAEEEHVYETETLMENNEIYSVNVSKTEYNTDERNEAFIKPIGVKLRDYEYFLYKKLKEENFLESFFNLDERLISVPTTRSTVENILYLPGVIEEASIELDKDIKQRRLHK